MTIPSGLLLIFAGIVLLVLGHGDQVNCVTTPCPQPEGATPVTVTGWVLVFSGAALSLGGAIHALLRTRRR